AGATLECETAPAAHIERRTDEIQYLCRQSRQVVRNCARVVNVHDRLSGFGKSDLCYVPFAENHAIDRRVDAAAHSMKEKAKSECDDDVNRQAEAGFHGAG